VIAQTPREHLFRCEIRDRKPMRQWSKGRVTIVGDAAHPTSPYAAYGAGMSIEDGYFLAAELERANPRDSGEVRHALQSFEERRKRYTARMSQQAYYTGLMFHRLPAPLRPLRDLIYDHTPLLQKVVGDAMPSEIVSQLVAIDDVEHRRREDPPDETN
jgi:2-polyprenyl-6-methoxyphenol hydroxylase-like FAD-dependent oxidoreductase